MHVGQRGQSSGVETTTGADTADTDDVHHSRTAACADDARTQASVCPQPAPSPSATNRHERLAKLAALRRSRRMASRPTKAMEKASTGVCVPAASLPTTTRPTLVAPCERESAPRNSPRFSLKNLPETGRFVLRATPEQLPRADYSLLEDETTRHALLKHLFDKPPRVNECGANEQATFYKQVKLFLHWAHLWQGSFHRKL